MILRNDIQIKIFISDDVNMQLLPNNMILFKCLIKRKMFKSTSLLKKYKNRAYFSIYIYIVKVGELIMVNSMEMFLSSHTNDVIVKVDLFKCHSEIQPLLIK